jgi:pimeloyl-ACP methyl ester carboxylesterase
MTADGSGLIVYVGGLNEKRAAIDPLLKRLGELPDLNGFDHYVYPTPIRRFSRGRLADRAEDLATAISNIWETQGKPSTVILMGHSIGGLLVRHAYLVAAGGFKDPEQEWAAHVSRIVLFAAPNLGLDIKRYGVPLRWIISFGLSLTHGWSAADIIRGAPFLANLRIQWIRSMPTMPDPPRVVQVRGTADTTVFEEDSVDLEAMPNSTTVEIFGADHKSIIAPSRPDEDRPNEQFELLTRAITGGFSASELAAKPPPDIASVVFLLHGIRAGIFGWVDRLGEIVRTRAPTVIVEQPSYGYLSAWKFMLPWGHDRQLRKFADWYTEMLSTYGSVDFHFVGHSNGTYILGRSLERVPAMRFKKVYLAGSVLPTDFPWTRYKTRDQVEELVNACGNKDFPVGVLCKALRGVGRGHLGTGGYNGFEDTSLVRKQFVTIDGSHAAGLVDDRLPAVADYVLTGSTPAGDLWTRAAPSGGFDNLSKFSGWLARLLAASVVGGIVLLGLWHLWVAAIGLGVIALILIVLSAV